MKGSEDIYWQEEEQLKQAQEVLAGLEKDQDIPQTEFKQLLKSYKALLKLARNLTKVSDKHQSKLKDIQDRLKRYVSPPIRKKIEQGIEKVEINQTKRVKLSIFFSDIKDFSTHSANMEGEALSAILNSYLEEMTNIVNEFGGTLDKYIGDAIMVFFGDPDFSNDFDHAHRCMKMALRMRDRMTELQKHWYELGYPAPLHVRMGISTGFVSVGNFGSSERMDYTIIGSPVNLASRLQQHAREDQILISHETWGYVKDIVDCKAEQTIKTLKGFPHGVIAHEVIGLKSDISKDCITIEDKEKGLLIRFNPNLCNPDEIRSLLMENTKT